jgi:prepilin-type N-terminal cleavage/methylation domain-containing protein
MKDEGGRMKKTTAGIIPFHPSSFRLPPYSPLDIPNNPVARAAERASMTYRRNPLSPRGFTMIEMLVVLGIIVVLATIAITSMGRVLEGQRRTKTKATLSNAVSMLAEYDAATAMRSQPGVMWDPGNPASNKRTAAFDIWKDGNPAIPADPTNPATPPTYEPLAAPGSVESDQETRLMSQAVLNTAVVIREISRMPGAKKMLSQMPGDATIKVNEPGAGVPVPIGPVMLDAWGNPIIFVPAAGLANVMLNDPPTSYVIRSHRTHLPSDTEISSGAAPPPAARPFFASAGADGSFTSGDDNIYSFQN